MDALKTRSILGYATVLLIATAFNGRFVTAQSVKLSLLNSPTLTVSAVPPPPNGVMNQLKAAAQPVAPVPIEQLLQQPNVQSDVQSNDEISWSVSLLIEQTRDEWGMQARRICDANEWPYAPCTSVSAVTPQPKNKLASELISANKPFIVVKGPAPRLGPVRNSLRQSGGNEKSHGAKNTPTVRPTQVRRAVPLQATHKIYAPTSGTQFAIETLESPPADSSSVDAHSDYHRVGFTPVPHSTSKAPR